MPPLLRHGPRPLHNRSHNTGDRVQGTSSSGIQHRHRRQDTQQYRLQQPVEPTKCHLMKRPRPRMRRCYVHPFQCYQKLVQSLRQLYHQPRQA